MVSSGCEQKILCLRGKLTASFVPPPQIYLKKASLPPKNQAPKSTKRLRTVGIDPNELNLEDMQMKLQSMEEFEGAFANLSPEAQAALLEWLERRVRVTIRDESDWELAAMASDPQIRQELSAIENEFRAAESDGLIPR